MNPPSPSIAGKFPGRISRRLLAGIFLAWTAHAGEGSGPNLCLPRYGAVFSGSLGELVTPAFLAGREPLKQIRLPPQTLIVTWPRPVTLRRQIILWKSRAVHGIHYGLERWDAEAGRYRLVYEETHNTRVRSVHDFPPFRTTRVRWTIFSHPLEYDAVTIRSLEFR